MRVIADTHRFWYTDIEQYWQNARGTGLRRLLDTLDAAQRARVRAALAERIGLQWPADGFYREATALLATAFSPQPVPART